MSALSHPAVGGYLNRHFVSAFQKVATFKIAGGAKQGGNVAGYFCTPGGRVLHALAGPVSATTFLKEARWANETYQLARLDQVTPDKLPAFFRRAHLERLRQDHDLTVSESQLPLPDAFTAEVLDQVLTHNLHLDLDDQGKVHLLLAVAPTPPLHEIYRVVFERILNEKISTAPVAVAGN